MTPLRIIFMGTPDFAVPTLQAIVDAGHEVACVYCQPPRPAGRGHKLQASPVQKLAESLSIPVRSPKSLRKPEEQEEFRALNADAAVVAAYGLILPKAILDAPRLGCFNVHGSLLPRWRGAAPVQRAILAGDNVTGVTIMQMDEGLDTGDMLQKGEVAITLSTKSPDLMRNLSLLGAKLMIQTLAKAQSGEISSMPQPSLGITYAAKLSKEEGRLDWTQPATELERKIRALTPWPGTWFEWNGEHIKVIEAEIMPTTIAAGKLIDEEFTISCGDHNGLRLLSVQKSGKPPTDGAAFLRGFPHTIGQDVT